jgi:ribosomal protein S18 acetylase RimI-like enzyme
MTAIALKKATESLLAEINRLVPQLSSSATAMTLAELEALINRDGTTLFGIEEAGEVVGMLTLVTFKIPTGTRAWIEDVVVDEKVRGKGFAKALVTAAIDEARKAGASTVDLTSRPSREAANALYRSMGFEQRETNVYRFNFD